MQQQPLAATARTLFGAPGHKRLQEILQAVVDTGAAAMFITEGTPDRQQADCYKAVNNQPPRWNKNKADTLL